MLAAACTQRLASKPASSAEVELFFGKSECTKRTDTPTPLTSLSLRNTPSPAPREQDDGRYSSTRIAGRRRRRRRRESGTDLGSQPHGNRTVVLFHRQVREIRGSWKHLYVRTHPRTTTSCGDDHDVAA